MIINESAMKIVDYIENSNKKVVGKNEIARAFNIDVRNVRKVTENLCNIKVLEKLGNDFYFISDEFLKERSLYKKVDEKENEEFRNKNRLEKTILLDLLHYLLGCSEHKSFFEISNSFKYPTESVYEILFQISTRLFKYIDRHQLSIKLTTDKSIDELFTEYENLNSDLTSDKVFGRLKNIRNNNIVTDIVKYLKKEDKFLSILQLSKKLKLNKKTTRREFRYYMKFKTFSDCFERKDFCSRGSSFAIRKNIFNNNEDLRIFSKLHFFELYHAKRSEDYEDSKNIMSYMQKNSDETNNESNRDEIKFELFKFLIDNRGSFSAKEIANKINVKENTIRNMVLKLNTYSKTFNEYVLCQQTVNCSGGGKLNNYSISELSAKEILEFGMESFISICYEEVRERKVKINNSKIEENPNIVEKDTITNMTSINKDTKNINQKESNISSVKNKTMIIEINNCIQSKKCPSCFTDNIRFLEDVADSDFIMVYCKDCGYMEGFKKLWYPVSEIKENKLLIRNEISNNEGNPLCGCGCNMPVSWDKSRKKWRKFVHGHNSRMLKNKKETDEPSFEDMVSNLREEANVGREEAINLLKEVNDPKTINSMLRR